MVFRKLPRSCAGVRLDSFANDRSASSPPYFPPVAVAIGGKYGGGQKAELDILSREPKQSPAQGPAIFRYQLKDPQTGDKEGEI